jgi:Holliday junction resolvasome RuvABC endonuclease subunit
MRTLALDLGTQTGWAFAANPAAVVRGAWDLSFTRRDATGRRHFDDGAARYARLVENLDRLREDLRFERVYFEEVRRHKGVIAAQIYGGLMSHLQTWCAAQGLPYRGVGVGPIKKHVTGKGNASKVEMLLALERAGYACGSEDEADALGLLLFVLGVPVKPLLFVGATGQAG